MLFIPLNYFLYSCHVLLLYTGFVHFSDQKFKDFSRAKFWNFKDLFFICVEEFIHGNSLTVQFLLIFLNVRAWKECKGTGNHSRSHSSLPLYHMYNLRGWLFSLSFQRLKMRVRKKSRAYNDREWRAEIFMDFQGLEMYSQNSRVFKGFQDAYEPCVHEPLTTHNSWICSNKGTTLEMP